MKIIIPFILCVQFISCNLFDKSPEFAIEMENYNFKQVNYDSVLSIRIPFKNSGKDTLKILKISADCGCTEVSTSDSVFNAGEYGTLNVTYSPKFNNDTGFVSKTIALRLNTKPEIHIVKISGSITAK